MTRSQVNEILNELSKSLPIEQVEEIEKYLIKCIKEERINLSPNDIVLNFIGVSKKTKGQENFTLKIVFDELEKISRNVLVTLKGNININQMHENFYNIEYLTI